MIAGMRPALQPGTWSFVPLGPDAPRLSQALATMREPEGRSAMLPAAPDDPLPMAHILLQVTSALDCVGLTAAGSTVLAVADSPCNVVAGHHHDHIFVPQSQATAALRILERRAAE